MNLSRIAPSQSVAKSPSDREAAETAGASDADFGSLLQAASDAPTRNTAQDRSARAVPARPRQDPAPETPESAQTRRTKGTKATPEPAPEANAAAAAAAVAVGTPDTKAQTTPAASAAATAAPAAPAAVGAAAATAEAADAIGANAASTAVPGAAGASPSNPRTAATAQPATAAQVPAQVPGQMPAQVTAQASTPASAPASAQVAVQVPAQGPVLTPDARTVATDGRSSDRLAAALTARIGLARSPLSSPGVVPSAGDASTDLAAVAAPLLSRLANGTQSTDGAAAGTADLTLSQAADMAGIDPAANFTAASLLASAAPTAAAAAQAVAQAVAGALGAADSKPGDGALSHAGPDATTPPDASGTAGASSGAFGPAPAYATEAHVSVATPVGHAAFGQDLSQQIVVLARRGVQSAQISLEPAGLGPVSVSIQIHGHEATLAFTAAHEATRHALEQALPRLRDMFASSGLQLSDATVGGRSQQEWTASGRPQLMTRDGIVAGGAPSSEIADTTRLVAVRLVDTYA